MWDVNSKAEVRCLWLIPDTSAVLQEGKQPPGSPLGALWVPTNTLNSAQELINNEQG